MFLYCYFRNCDYILGTKWCGDGNKSASYHDLGYWDRLDRCCREHDHCPLSIHSDKQRWGVKNTVGYTVSDCKCDDRFYNCLKKVLINFYHLSRTTISATLQTSQHF